jgi:hypothetical protein
MRIEDTKPRKKSLLSSLFKNVKHAIKYYDGPKWKPDYKIRNEKWQEKNKKIETLIPSNLVKIKARKNRIKTRDALKINTGLRSDQAMIKRETGKRAGPIFRLANSKSSGWYTLPSKK